MMSELEDIMKQPHPHVAAVALVAELVQAMLIFSHDFHPLPKERVDELAELAERAREIFGKAVKTEVSSDGLSHLSRLARALQHPWQTDDVRSARCAPRIHEWAPEIPGASPTRRAAGPARRCGEAKGARRARGCGRLAARHGASGRQ